MRLMYSRHAYMQKGKQLQRSFKKIKKRHVSNALLIINATSNAILFLQHALHLVSEGLMLPPAEAFRSSSSQHQMGLNLNSRWLPGRASFILQPYFLHSSSHKQNIQVNTM